MLLYVLLIITLGITLYILYGSYIAVVLIHVKVFEGNTATKDLDKSTIAGVTFVEIPSEIGILPAWQTNDKSNTWILIAHGLSGEIQDTEHIVKLAQSLNLTALSFTYRNHAGAPITDGRSTFGRTEVHDVEAAVKYAKSHGAEHVLFVGMSHGGSIGLAAAYNSTVKKDIKTMILQSPAVHSKKIISAQVKKRLPFFGVQIAHIAMWWISMTERIPWHFSNYIKRSKELEVPVLIMHGTSDDLVPFHCSEELARQRPDLIELIPFDGAEHIREHEQDVDKFNSAFLDFVQRNRSS